MNKKRAARFVLSAAPAAALALFAWLAAPSFASMENDFLRRRSESKAFEAKRRKSFALYKTERQNQILQKERERERFRKIRQKSLNVREKRDRNEKFHAAAEEKRGGLRARARREFRKTRLHEKKEQAFRPQDLPF